MKMESNLEPVCLEGNVFSMFHKAWGMAKDSPDYDKEVFKTMEVQILWLQTRARAQIDSCGLNDLAKLVHDAHAKWWVDLKTGLPIQRNVGELLMLVTSELAEAMEGHRKSLKDDKLPHRDMFEVEVADAMIRLLDIAGGMRLDLEGAMIEKMRYNATRIDHTAEHRLAPGGKAY